MKGLLCCFSEPAIVTFKKKKKKKQLGELNLSGVLDKEEKCSPVTTACVYILKSDEKSGISEYERMLSRFFSLPNSDFRYLKTTLD